MTTRAFSLAIVLLLLATACRTPEAASPGALTVRVLVLNFDPLVDGRPLHARLSWNAPRTLADGYLGDVQAATAGHVRFVIVQWRDIDAFPVKTDGFTYSAAEYLARHAAGSGWHEPDGADYPRLLTEQGAPTRVDSGEIDEVWLFGGPWFGYYESAMAGPRAFDINGGTFGGVKVGRPFAIMGFNYERGVAEMLENLCHRVEATMSRIYGGWRADALEHNWARFAANEAQSRAAAVGSCHFPPNAEREYDFGNPRAVTSTAAAWLTYPNLSAPPSRVSRETWGGPDYARSYFRWWFRHLPRAPGVNSDERLNDWWQYVYDFDRYDERGRPRP